MSRPKLYSEADAGFDVEGFRAWLRTPAACERASGRRQFVQGYQPLTVLTLVEAAMRLERQLAAGRQPQDWPRNPQTHQVVGRLLAWPGELPPAFRAACEAFLEGWRGPARRAQPERSIDDAAWGKFLGELEARPGPEPVVLRLMSATGLRVGDVLRIKREPVLRALTGSEGLVDLTVKGGKPRVRAIAGAPEEWAALGALFAAAPDAKNVHELVCPGKPTALGTGPAYARVRAELQDAAEKAGVAGRVHLHRLRRTVAVRALRTTGDIALVAQLLDQRSIHTTMKYVDEARTEDVAKLERQLAEQRRKK